MHQLVTLGGLSIAGATPLSGEVRPRCLAVLAILAAAGPRGMSRERLMAILWPSRTPERARHSFSQALYALRVDLGTDVVVTHRQLRLDPGRITSYVEELHTAATAADWEHAAAVFVGPFLDGFYLAAAPEFERWVDGERASVAATALQCIERAGEALDIQDPARALAHWRRLAALDPLNARYAIACIERLVQRGERTGALACATAHAAMVRTEFDTEPDARVVFGCGRREQRK